MRITNKMMTNNMMNNINKNKLNMNLLEQQYSTGKKIQKPSDDPIVTVRALKLRTNLSELEQYFEKNIPDAMSWMEVTESALKTVNSILKQINTYCVQGSTDTLTATDRNSIVQNLEQMKQQIYQEGNANYAGRYVFTGYKTDSPLVFTEASKNLSYMITENISTEQIQFVQKVSGAYEISDYDDPSVTFDQTPILKENYRIQLSYDNLGDTPPTEIKLYKKNTAGELIEQTPAFTNIVKISATEEGAYEPAGDQIHFIPETGELILGSGVYEIFRQVDNISVEYSKSTFEKGDLKPEHYFNCVVTDTAKPEQAPITYTKTKQEIRYEVNFNQKLTINTEGSDAITHQIGRCIDDILDSVNDVILTENKIAEIEKRLEDESLTADQRERYEKMKEQLDMELVLKKEVMQKAFAKGITVSNEEQDRVNVAVADLGSRFVRLELTENRLSGQMVDFEDLLSKNEDVDIVETLIKLTAAETIYNASLSAASKVVQNTLLDFL